jgi:hypothetical protein
MKENSKPVEVGSKLSKGSKEWMEMLLRNVGFTPNSKALQPREPLQSQIQQRNRLLKLSKLNWSKLKQINSRNVDSNNPVLKGCRPMQTRV